MNNRNYRRTQSNNIFDQIQDELDGIAGYFFAWLFCMGFFAIMFYIAVLASNPIFLVLGLSLRFNHGEFCDGLYLHRKTLRDRGFYWFRRSS